MSLVDSAFAAAGRRAVVALAFVWGGLTGAAHAQDLTDARVLSAQDLATFGSNQSPAIATDGSTWIAAWWSEQVGGNWNIQIARSTNHGESWSLVTNGNDVDHPLFPGAANIFTSTCSDVQPDVAAGAAGEFVIVWSRQEGDHSQLFSSISSDGGVSWSAPSQLTTTPRNECPHIAYGLDQESGGTNRWIVTWTAGVPGDPNWNIQVANVDPNPLAMTLQNQVELTSDPGTTNVYPSIATDRAGRWLIGWSSRDGSNDTVRYAYSNDLAGAWNVGSVAGYTSGTCGHGAGGRPTRTTTDGTVWGVHFLLAGPHEATSLWPPSALTLTSCIPLADFAMSDVQANPATGQWVMAGTVQEFDGETFRRIKILRGTGNATTGAVDWEASSIYVYASVNHGTSAESGASLGDSYGADIATNGTHWVMLWSSTDSLEVGSPASSHYGSMLVTSTPRCGDGNQDAGEDCDDGGRTYDPLCDSNCTVPACGNGAASGGETCDDGNLTSGDGCDENCTATGCPNGVVTAGEACDDGDAVEGDECDSNCTIPACGNGVEGGAETCDDGNLSDGDGCDSNCTPTGCPNGIVTAGEACDDGDAVEGDECDSNCTIPACGNGVEGGAETCDDGNLADGDGCDSNCAPTGCPNGIVTAGEACDDGDAVEGDECDSNCTIPACGNGIEGGAETCDDGNLADGDGCDSNCTPTGCPNGIRTGSEICDDGNLSEADGCSNTCSLIGCGDGNVAAGEACDDANVTNDDGCDANCQPTSCGNGIVTSGEECDDGNVDDGDACESNCTTPRCGNGIVSAGEPCDDGNAVSGDGCDNNCTPSECGNGERFGGEHCDDGNLVDGDGCESDCLLTPVSVSEDLPAGGTLSTDGGSGPTPQYPVSTGVTAPNGGTVSISQDTIDSSNLTEGYLFLGQQMTISAPEATVEQPLEIFFTLEGSLVGPFILGHSFASIYRNGALVGDCTGPVGHAVPSPCVSSRVVDENGDYRFSVLTAAASQWMMTTPSHDVVVLPAKPVHLTLPAGAAGYTKKLSVKVSNADAASSEPATIRLVASTTCPAATVTADFDTSTAEADDTVAVQPGKTAKATVLLQFRASSMHSIAPVNDDAPFRCAVTYQALVTSPEGSQDVNESNNSFTVQGVNIVNENVEPAASAETLAVSAKPIRIKIPLASGADPDPVVTKTAKVTVFNADVLPVPAQPGHEIEVTIDDGTCPEGTVGLADFDPSTDGAQSSALVAGGKKRSARVAITVRSSDFTSPGKSSPARCIATATTSGPGGDLDATNDVTNLVIDVTDLNDFD